MKSSLLPEIVEKVYCGKRISEEEALSLLFEEVLLGQIGELADFKRTRLHGNKVYFVRNSHLNLTNICISKCKFCSFRKKPDEEGAYVLNAEEVKELVRQACRAGVTEVHVVSALNPKLPFEYYLDVVRGIKEIAPHITIKGFTAVEIDYLSRISGLTWEGVIGRLNESGVEYLAGGGAEIFNQRVRVLLGTFKTPGQKWLKIHEIAHLKGISTNATMLYGHFERAEDVVEHLRMLRDLQDKTGGFQAFIPLKFIPFDTELDIKESSSVYDLRIIALSRIFLDNFPHIKAYWVSLTPEIAQIALSFGADDLDGTVMKEKIIHAAGVKVKEGMSAEELKLLIKGAGFEPVERDSFYSEIKKD